MKRLKQGGLVDRTRKITFYFDGKRYKGYPGDTLASALLANNVRLVARSFKYHRPRGIVTAGSEEPSALAEIGEVKYRIPNSRMTTQMLYDNMYARAQHAFPSINYDFGAINNHLSRFLGAGFYYKTFMGNTRNTKFWMFCEKFIRRAAGLGRVALVDDKVYFEHFHAHTDILIVGGGVAGIWSAYRAGLQGAKVILVDQNFIIGSQLLGAEDKVDNASLYQWGQMLLDKLQHMDNVTLLPCSTVFGLYDGNVAAVVERVHHNSSRTQTNALLVDGETIPDSEHHGVPYERRWKIYYQKAILASGAIERHLVFGNNDLPGVMLSEAVERYINEYAVLPARKNAVVFTNNDYAYRTAFALRKNGIQTVIVDARLPNDKTKQYIDKARGLGITVHSGAVVTYARGKKAVRSVRVHQFDAQTGELHRKGHHVRADLLAVSGGFTPTIHLLCHLGAKVKMKDDTLVMPENAPAIVAGSAATMHGMKAVLQSAEKAVQQAFADLDLPLAEHDLPAIDEHDPYSPSLPLWEVPCFTDVKKFADLQHDVTAKDLHQTVQEGYHNAEHAKRYSTASMATDQGKISAMNIAGILADARGDDLNDVGLTSWRPPFTPVSLGAFAATQRGSHIQPFRKTPMHQWHEENGAVMVEAGLWMRPRYYRQHGRNITEAYIHEMHRVRKFAGLCDISTLGKIDVVGPDAAEFLNRVYVNKFLKLKVGKARYGVMLREDGIILDDGTAVRLDDNHFYMTTTTAQAGTVMNHLEYHLSVIWPDLKVRISSVTDQWAAMALSGPLAREILSQMTKEDVSDEALPFMGVGHFICKDIPVRVMRISFSGELAYELHTPAHFGLPLWTSILKTGGNQIIPYGTEALTSLRIEKGHIAGAEITGHTSLRDVGLDGMAGNQKDYIGKILSLRAGLNHDEREQLVGIKMHKNRRYVRGGATVLVKDKTMPKAEAAIGRITSFCYSNVVGQNIALALVKDGRNRHGEKVLLKDFVRGINSEGEICDPIFYDKKGEMVRG
ncbi:MAG: (2Fe-2S)-binding protein [Alphaproteobacteria bacterium]|nr:(2Fe-2S)-binding protein [Alphaproteobacteria bacterium]